MQILSQTRSTLGFTPAVGQLPPILNPVDRSQFRYCAHDFLVVNSEKNFVLSCVKLFFFFGGFWLIRENGLSLHLQDLIGLIREECDVAATGM